MKYLVILFFIFISCEKKQETTKEVESVYTLNGAEKWEMDAHTRSSIKKINMLFIEPSRLKSIQDYNQIGNEFQRLLDKLTIGCTMEGEAHEQLHIFIGQVFHPLQNLKVDSVEVEAKKNYTSLKNSLIEYGKFFK